MSLQPLSNSQPAAEVAAQRRRPAERDGGSESEAFVLPAGEAAKDAPAPVREEARASVRDGGETRRAGDEANAPEAAAPEKATKPAAATPVEGSGKPVAQPADAAPVVQPAVQNLDVAALISIAVAAEAGIGADKTIKDSAGKEEVGEGGTGETDASGAIIVPAEPKAENVPVAALSTPIVAVMVPAAVVTTPPDGAAQAPEAPEETIPAGKYSAAVSGAVALAAAQAGAAGPAAEATPAATAAGEGETAAKSALPKPAAEISALPSGIGQTVMQGEEKAGVDPLIAMQGQKRASDEVKAPSALPATPAASAPAEAKLEALQQALNPIDLSALGQQGGARPEPARIPGMPESAPAQPLPSPQGQGAAGGPPTPLHVLPIEIGLKALAGARQFDIRLDPGELGRVDVNLSISEDGEVSARMVVDRVETLHLLQRDARTLERAFEQAGLKPSEGGVDISLRDPSDQSGFRQGRQQEEAPQRARGLAAGQEQGEDNTIPAQPAPVRRFVRLGGVDLSV